MSKLDKKTLENLTKLCRINCSEKEIETLQHKLHSVLDYIDQLQDVDTEGVATCNHVAESHSNALREDQTEATLSRETFLENSPSHVGGMIRVPTVIKF